MKTPLTPLPKNLEESKLWDTSNAQSVPFDQIAQKIEMQASPKKRGRPPKNAVTSAVSGSGTVSTTSGTHTSSEAFPQGPLGVSGAQAVSLRSSGIPPELIRNGIELPFAVAASQTGFAGFCLVKEESDPLVPQADHLIATYLPNLGPNAPIYIFSASIVGLALTKYMAFQQWKSLEEKKAKINPKNQNEVL